MKSGYGRKKILTLSTKKAMVGYLFSLPFIIGFLMFFLVPFIQTFIFSLSTIQLADNGYMLIFQKLKNYYNIFNVNPDFRRILLGSLYNMAVNVPIIVIFSFFIANLLNQKFKGRAFARAVFFMPVIMITGCITVLEAGDYLTASSQAAVSSVGSSADGLAFINIGNLLLENGIPPSIVNMVNYVIGNLYTVVTMSGVQILIFLAGLQNIPRSIFEACEIEGATAWESFWMITFPMISPLMLVNLIYTVIEFLTRADNPVMYQVRMYAFYNNDFGISSAMAMSYFLIISVIVGAITLIVSRKVFYQ